MLSFVLTALLAVPNPIPITASPANSAVQEDADRTAAALASLEKAFKRGTSAAQRVRAIEDARSVIDPEVIRAIARGLTDRNLDVQRAAIDALGWMFDTESVTQLEKFYKSQAKKLQKQGTLMAPFLKALGRHGSPSSVATLADSPTSVRTYEAIQARIMGLANIRTLESVDAIISILKRSGMRDLETWMGELRLPLYYVTGTDQGPDPRMWGDWWRDVKKTFRIPEEVPPLTPEQQATWDAYWGWTDENRPGTDED